MHGKFCVDTSGLSVVKMGEGRRICSVGVWLF